MFFLRVLDHLHLRVCVFECELWYKREISTLSCILRICVDLKILWKTLCWFGGYYIGYYTNFVDLAFVWNFRELLCSDLLRIIILGSDGVSKTCLKWDDYTKYCWGLEVCFWSRMVFDSRIIVWICCVEFLELLCCWYSCDHVLCMEFLSDQIIRLFGNLKILNQDL